MFKSYNLIKKINDKANDKSVSIRGEPKMSIKKWYELQHKYREEQMAHAKALK